MTNNPTIDGVSRELLEEFIALSIQGKIGNWVNLRNELRALLDAPAVERQEICGKHSGDSCKSCGGSGLVNDGELTCSSGGEPYENGPIECLKDCPECQGAHQSTIARLEARIAELQSGRSEPVLIQAVAVTRDDGDEGLRLEWLLEGGISELEFSGTVLFAMPEANDLCDESGSADIYTAPPAPVAVVQFANELIDGAFEGGNFGGDDIQDIGVKHGLLSIETRDGPCGEFCACKEYGFPAECYRKTACLDATAALNKSP